MTRRWSKRLAGLMLAAPLALLSMVTMAPAASAHPLGNFTVNSFSNVRVEPHAVAVALVVDSAEIPTAQQFPDAATVGGVSSAKAADYGAQQCSRLMPGVRVSVAGVRTLSPLRQATLSWSMAKQVCARCA